MVKSNFKKVLSVALALVLCVSMFATMAISSSAEAEVPTTPIHQIDVPAEDGVYFAQVDLMNATSNQPSMGNASLRGSSTYKTKQPGDTDYYKAIVIVKDNKATAIVEFMPMGYIGMVGFLMELESTTPDYLQQWGGIYDESCKYVPTQALVSHSTLDGKAIYDNYNDPASSQAFNGTQMRPAGYGHPTERPLNIIDQSYAHVVAVDVTPITTGDDPVPTAAADYIWKNAAYVHVFVPVMYSIMPTSGDQHARLKVDWTTMEKIEKPEDNLHYRLWSAKQIKADGYTEDSYNALQTAINNVTTKLNNIWPVQKLNMIGSGMNAMPELCQVEYTADEKAAMAAEINTAVANLEPAGAAPVEPSAPLVFKGAGLMLQSSIAVDFRVDAAALNEYTDIYAEFTLNGVTTKVTDYTVDGNRLIFRYNKLKPSQLGDDIHAVVHGTFNGKDYTDTVDYGVHTYVTNMLGKTANDPAYASFRTLLVDLMNYGAASQVFTSYKVETLVNKLLTPEQLKEGTQSAPTLSSIMNRDFNVVENATVKFKGAGLYLRDAVKLNFMIEAADLTGLSAKVEVAGRTYEIPATDFVADAQGRPDRYEIVFDKLSAGEMSDAVDITILRDGVAVSNTLRYSVESYADSKVSGADALADLVAAMMNYGNAAKAYAK